MDNAAVAGAMADSAGSGALAMLKSFAAKAKATFTNREAVQYAPATLRAALSQPPQPRSRSGSPPVGCK